MAIPDGLADTPPGPELGALLAAIDPARVANGATVTVLQAWRRQRSHSDAAELAMLAEVGRCDPVTPPERVARLEAAHPNCGIEIAAALTLTELSAWREHALADTVVHRLPTVHAALAAGHIDRAKAMVFADLLEPLTDTQNARVCAALVPKAPGLTTGQLRARLRRMVIAIDPDAARRRYQRALRQRRVICYLDQDGTATLSATGLDPTAAQAACERLDALARAIRAAGHPDPLPAVRVDLATALLDGSLHTLSHDQIVTVMLARAAEPDPDAGTDPESAAVDRSSGDDGTSNSGRGGDEDNDSGGEDDCSGSGVGSEDGRSGGSSENGGSGSGGDHRNDHGNGDGGGGGGGGEDGDGGGDDGSPQGDGGDDGPRDDSPRDGGTGGPGRRSEPARPGIEIRIRLSTLLGHDEHPGEVPGLGPILAPTARAGIARHHHGEWRLAITDTDGYLVLAGTTRRRPPAPAPTGQAGPAGREGHPLIRQAHGGTVELQIPAALLRQLSAQPPPGWESLLADLASQYARRSALGAALDQRSGDRFPCPALRRHVEIRDRTCIFIGCLRPARKSQQDHTLEHQHDGPTVRANLGPLCVLHHALKTTGLWRLQQPAPGVFRWRSPLHRVYVTRGEPVCPPLPDPVPGDTPESPWPEPAPPNRLQDALDDLPLWSRVPVPAPVPASTAITTAADRAPPARPPF